MRKQLGDLLIQVNRDERSIGIQFNLPTDEDVNFDDFLQESFTPAAFLVSSVLLGYVAQRAEDEMVKMQALVAREALMI